MFIIWIDFHAYFIRFAFLAEWIETKCHKTVSCVNRIIYDLKSVFVYFGTYFRHLLQLIWCKRSISNEISCTSCSVVRWYYPIVMFRLFFVFGNKLSVFAFGLWWISLFKSSQSIAHHDNGDPRAFWLKSFFFRRLYFPLLYRTKKVISVCHSCNIEHCEWNIFEMDFGMYVVFLLLFCNSTLKWSKSSQFYFYLKRQISMCFLLDVKITCGFFTWI